MSAETPKPTDADAARIVREVVGDEPQRVNRFATGLCHYVFDMTTRRGKQIVVRIAEHTNRQYLQSAMYWSGILRPIGVPLPEVLHADLDAPGGAFPYLVLERLPGTDLAHVYAQLTRHQKQAIAQQVVEVQRLVGQLPEGTGFGHALGYDQIPYRCWKDVIAANLDRSAAWIANAGVVDPAIVEPLRAIAVEMERDFGVVRPTPFLDDTTTKNVIIDNGRMTGIVDVDEVCFGDPLLTPALTQMALLALDRDTEYVELWCDALQLRGSQRRVFTFYTAVFCVNFLGEMGQQFNASIAPHVEKQKVAKLLGILDGLLKDLREPSGT